MKTILFVVIALLVVSILTPNVFATKKSPYDSGYDHGCDDAKISDYSERYINQYEKGPAFHTDRFMDGYNNGYGACSGGSVQQQPSQSQAQSSNNENNNENNNALSQSQNTNIYICNEGKCVPR